MAFTVSHPAVRSWRSPAPMVRPQAFPGSAGRRGGCRPRGARITSTRASSTDAPVVIVGAGLAGLATAAALHKARELHQQQSARGRALIAQLHTFCIFFSEDHLPFPPPPLLPSCLLPQVGIPALVLEQGTALRNEGAAIGLWSNAWRALDALGAADALRSKSLSLNKVQIARDSGRSLRTFGFDECDGGADQEFRGDSRRHFAHWPSFYAYADTMNASARPLGSPPRRAPGRLASPLV